MILIFTEKDLNRVVDEYIKLRETVGLARDTAKFGAVKNIVDHANLRRAVEEDTGLQLTVNESKITTDKPSSPEEIKQ